MPTPYKIKVDLIDESGNPSTKELILHEDNEGADIKGRLITKSAFKKIRNSSIKTSIIFCCLNQGIIFIK